MQLLALEDNAGIQSEHVCTAFWMIMQPVTMAQLVTGFLLKHY